MKTRHGVENTEEEMSRASTYEPKGAWYYTPMVPDRELSGELGFCVPLLSSSDPPGTGSSGCLQRGAVYPPASASLPMLFPLYRQTEAKLVLLKCYRGHIQHRLRLKDLREWQESRSMVLEEMTDYFVTCQQNCKHVTFTSDEETRQVFGSLIDLSLVHLPVYTFG